MREQLQTRIAIVGGTLAFILLLAAVRSLNIAAAQQIAPSWDCYLVEMAGTPTPVFHPESGLPGEIDYYYHPLGPQAPDSLAMEELWQPDHIICTVQGVKSADLDSIFGVSLPEPPLSSSLELVPPHTFKQGPPLP